MALKRFKLKPLRDILLYLYNAGKPCQCILEVPPVKWEKHQNPEEDLFHLQNSLINN